MTNLHVEILSHTPEPEKVVAMAAKLCYSSSDITTLKDSLTDEKIEAFLKNLPSAHQSPLEHVSFTFGIEGVSRSLTHQLVRHRLASYSQKSQRYISEDQFDYITPDDIKNDDDLTSYFNETMNILQGRYNYIKNKLIENYLMEGPWGEFYVNYTDWAWENMKDCSILDDRIDAFIEYMKDNQKRSDISDLKKDIKAYSKRACENARAILPNACETKIIVTMNARELLHYFNERCCERAQDEHRIMAIEMLKLCKQVAPLLFKNAGPSCVRGTCKEGRMTCGNPKQSRDFE